VYVWELFNGKGEDKLHISPLLCTFEMVDDDKREYYLLFPWASGDLRQLWKNNPSADGRYTSRWMAEQCSGIAEALSVIHQDRVTNEPTEDGANNEPQRYGRHGDVKPCNILWFAEHIGCDNAGTLALADFGIAKCHRAKTKSLSDPVNAKYSPTYKSPEFDVSSSKIGRKADIWGLACTWIEFVTWYLKGWQAVEVEFPEARDEADPVNANISLDTYFRVTEEGAIVKPQVVKWMKKLHGENRCNHFLHDLLSYIEKRMLVVDPSERATAHEVSEKLKELHKKTTRDSVYANSPLSQCPASCQAGPF